MFWNKKIKYLYFRLFSILSIFNRVNFSVYFDITSTKIGHIWWDMWFRNFLVFLSFKYSRLESVRYDGREMCCCFKIDTIFVKKERSDKLHSFNLPILRRRKIQNTNTDRQIRRQILNQLIRSIRFWLADLESGWEGREKFLFSISHQRISIEATSIFSSVWELPVTADSAIKFGSNWMLKKIYLCCFNFIRFPADVPFCSSVSSYSNFHEISATFSSCIIWVLSIECQFLSWIWFKFSL